MIVAIIWVARDAAEPTNPTTDRTTAEPSATICMGIPRMSIPPGLNNICREYAPAQGRSAVPAGERP